MIPLLVMTSFFFAISATLRFSSWAEGWLKPSVAADVVTPAPNAFPSSGAGRRRRQRGHFRTEGK